MARTKHTLEDLKEEITELKLSDIRKDITALKEYLTTSNDVTERKIDELIKHVKTTNGSVAKVTSEHMELQQEYSKHMEMHTKTAETIDKIDKETKVVRWIMKKPVIVGIVILAILWSLTIPDIREFVSNLLKIAL